jgi:hypothetical protein
MAKANETKWTAGPWVMRGADTYRWQVETASAPKKAIVVARITTPSRGGAAASEANARLIAAAPEMAEAIRSARSDLVDLLTGKCEGGHPDIDDQTRRDLQAIADALKAALAKTEGRS